MESNARLVKTAQLSEDQGKQVEALVAACRGEDRLDADLYLESDITGGRINQILSYVEDELVGVASLSSDEGIEVQILVHPAQRRGIGRALLEGVRDEAKHRGTPHLLLVCDGDSAPSDAFARAIGARHAYTEYRMQFDPAAPQTSAGRVAGPEDHIRLQQAATEHPDILINLAAAGQDPHRRQFGSGLLHGLKNRINAYTSVRSRAAPPWACRASPRTRRTFTSTRSASFRNFAAASAGDGCSWRSFGCCQARANRAAGGGSGEPERPFPLPVMRLQANQRLPILGYSALSTSVS